jgi:hypothetical protein
MSVIPALQEVVIENILVQGQPGEKVSKTLISTKQARGSGACL